MISIDSLQSKRDVWHRETFFIIDNSVAGLERLHSPAQCDIDVCSFASFAYLDNRGFRLITDVGIKYAFVRGTPYRETAGKGVVAAPDRYFVALGNDSKHTVDPAIISINIACRIKLSPLLLKNVGAIETNYLLNNRTSIRIDYLSGDNSPTNKRKVDILNSFSFSQYNAVA